MEIQLCKVSLLSSLVVLMHYTLKNHNSPASEPCHQPESPRSDLEWWARSQRWRQCPGCWCWRCRPRGWRGEPRSGSDGRSRPNGTGTILQELGATGENLIEWKYSMEKSFAYQFNHSDEWDELGHHHFRWRIFHRLENQLKWAFESGRIQRIRLVLSLTMS